MATRRQNSGLYDPTFDGSDRERLGWGLSDDQEDRPPAEASEQTGDERLDEILAIYHRLDEDGREAALQSMREHQDNFDRDTLPPPPGGPDLTSIRDSVMMMEETLERHGYRSAGTLTNTIEALTRIAHSHLREAPDQRTALGREDMRARLTNEMRGYLALSLSPRPVPRALLTDLDDVVRNLLVERDLNRPPPWAPLPADTPRSPNALPTIYEVTTLVDRGVRPAVSTLPYSPGFNDALVHNVRNAFHNGLQERGRTLEPRELTEELSARACSALLDQLPNGIPAHVRRAVNETAAHLAGATPAASTPRTSLLYPLDQLLAGQGYAPTERIRHLDALDEIVRSTLGSGQGRVLGLALGNRLGEALASYLAGLFSPLTLPTAMRNTAHSVAFEAVAQHLRSQGPLTDPRPAPPPPPPDAYSHLLDD